MTDVNDDQRALLNNYLAFLASHRGSITSLEGNVAVTSKAQGFSTLFATGAPLSRVAIGDRSLRLLPWSEGWTWTLPTLGATQSAEMIFMTRDPRTPCPEYPPSARYEARRIRTDTELIAFAETQAQAFLGPNDPQFAWWRAFMERAALANAANPRQRFFLTFSDAAPVGTLLSVDTDALAGFYAVATLPEHRRRGVCTALMCAAESDAVARGLQKVTLQVMADSVAETVYRRLGYLEVFRTPIFSLAPICA